MAGADVWLKDAKENLAAAHALKKIGQHRQAYHNAGQAIEFALKALYMKRRGLSAWPEDLRGADWHNLTKIADAAGMAGDIASIKAKKRETYTYWLVVRSWDSNARFPDSRPPMQELNDLFTGVCHSGDGVMEWLEAIYHAI